MPHKLRLPPVNHVLGRVVSVVLFQHREANGLLGLLAVAVGAARLTVHPAGLIPSTVRRAMRTLALALHHVGQH